MQQKCSSHLYLYCVKSCKSFIEKEYEYRFLIKREIIHYNDVINIDFTTTNVERNEPYQFLIPQNAFLTKRQRNDVNEHIKDKQIRKSICFVYIYISFVCKKFNCKMFVCLI